MPVELSDLLSNKRWVPVEVAGHIINVAYKPGATSLRRQAELQKQMRKLQAAENADELEVVVEVARVFAEMVCDWDLTQGGRPLPINQETVSDLPGVVYNAIMEAINADGKSREDEKKALSATSGVGSQPGDKLALVQNGTHPSERRGTWA